MIPTTSSAAKTLFAALLVAHVAAQNGELPPSPTASIGCSAHEDHWHCDGPRETGEVMSILPTDDLSTVTPSIDSSLASPTGSMSILPTDDLSSVASSVSEAEGTMSVLPTNDLETVSGKDDHPTGTMSIGESGTTAGGSEETGGPGCVKHGDHYHCDGEDHDDDETEHSAGNNTDSTNGDNAADELGDEDNAAAGVKVGGLAAVLAVMGMMVL